MVVSHGVNGLLLRDSTSLSLIISTGTLKKAQTSAMARTKKPYIVPIDKTTMHDTITSRQWHKFRDEELEKMREEKEEE